MVHNVTWLVSFSKKHTGNPQCKALHYTKSSSNPQVKQDMHLCGSLIYMNDRDFPFPFESHSVDAAPSISSTNDNAVITNKLFL